MFLLFFFFTFAVGEDAAGALLSQLGKEAMLTYVQGRLGRAFASLAGDFPTFLSTLEALQPDQSDMPVMF